MIPDIQIHELPITVQGEKAFSLRNTSRKDDVPSDSVKTLEK